MDSPPSGHFAETSCGNIDQDVTTNDVDFSKFISTMCMHKLSIYLYVTLQRRGVFVNPQKSTEEIAGDFQVETLAKHTLEKQQRRLLSDLLNVEDDPSFEEPMDFVEEPHSVDEPVSGENGNEEGDVEPEPLQLTERDHENVIFMNSMTRLKAFVMSNVAVPRSAIEQLIAPMLSLGQPSLEPTNAAIFSDSGFGSLSTQRSSVSSFSGNVPTRDLFNVMRAARCNTILCQSADSVISRLQTVVAKNDVSVYENWEGSFYELSINTLNRLVECLSLEDEENEVRKKCAAFVEKAIVDLLTFEGIDNRLLNLKYYFIVSIVDNLYTCYDTINILFEKLSVFETYAKDPDYNYRLPIHTIETSYYILKMLEAFIQYYVCSTKAKAKGDDAKRQPYDDRGKKRGHCFNDPVDEGEVKRNINNWIKILERCNVSFTGTFCLHAIMGSEILTNILQPAL